jgi:SAM-dependent methyltransferase
VETAQSYRSLYDNFETSTWAREIQRPDWDLIIEQIKSTKPQGARILDFGCYTGGLLSLLDSRYERFGIEINSEASDIARTTASAHIWNSLDLIEGDQQFDVVVMADVLEHMPSPLQFLESVSPLIADDGVLIVTTGDADTPLWNLFGANWWYCFYPEHISFISEAWLDRVLNYTDWSLVTLKRFRYSNPHGLRLISDFLFAWAYGLFPRTYLHLARQFKRSPNSLSSVAGNGISLDHLLIVLKKSRRQ